LQLCTLKSRATGLYFIDSKKLVVCDNHRIDIGFPHQNFKVRFM
jgi:hypothetical protein